MALQKKEREGLAEAEGEGEGEGSECCGRQGGVLSRNGMSLFHHIVGKESEERVLRTLLDFFSAMISNMPTTMEQDESLFSHLEGLRLQEESGVGAGAGEGVKEGLNGVELVYDSEQYWKLLNAVKYRLTRKKLLHRGLLMCEKIAALLIGRAAEVGSSAEVS